MALQLGSLRDALIEAGATSTSAISAAAEVGEYDSRLAATDTRLAVLTWMAGANGICSPLGNRGKSICTMQTECCTDQ